MTVIIGRRELFAFAERYSSCRLKDFTDLADGVVLCSLFNRVFPDLRIRLASPQTHTLSQRTQANWAALRAALDDVGIPPDLLDQAALGRGDVEKGFSALVLFYFLYHLTKRTDFSAEFATDVTEALTEFLQSIDSISALVVGGALPLSAVPPHLQEQIRCATKTRKQRHGPRREPKRKRNVASSSVLSLDVGAVGDKEHFEKQLSFNSEVTSAGSHMSLDEAMEEACRSSADTVAMVPHGSQRPSEQVPNKVEKKTSLDISNCDARDRQTAEGERNALDASVLRREVELQQALVAKSEECAELKIQNLELLSQLARLRAEKSVNTSSSMSIEKDVSERKSGAEQERVAMMEEELVHLRRMLQNTKEERRSQSSMNVAFAEELLKDVVDTETGEVVNVHETATLLHGVILDALRDSPRKRREAQKWLWLIVSAYHVIETRLVTACDVAAMEWQCLKGGGSSPNSNGESSGACAATPGVLSTPSTAPKKVQIFHGTSSPLSSPDASASACRAELLKLETELERRQQKFESQLAELHTNEKSLRQRVHQLEDHLRRFTQKTSEREAKWKSLCAAIHHAERTSFAIAEAETAEAVERLLAQRRSLYARIDGESAVLLQDGADSSLNVASEPTGSHDVCKAMQTLLQSVTQDRDRLQREVMALRQEAQVSAQQPEKDLHANKLKNVIRSRLEEQKEYEEDEVWFVRADARPPFTLSYPPTKQTPLTLKTAKIFGDQDAVSPFGRNLSALLTSAVPAGVDGNQ